jgi:hypothetical protein
MRSRRSQTARPLVLIQRLRRTITPAATARIRRTFLRMNVAMLIRSWVNHGSVCPKPSKNSANFGTT